MVAIERNHGGLWLLVTVFYVTAIKVLDKRSVYVHVESKEKKDWISRAPKGVVVCPKISCNVSILLADRISYHFWAIDCDVCWCWYPHHSIFKFSYCLVISKCAFFAQSVFVNYRSGCDKIHKNRKYRVNQPEFAYLFVENLFLSQLFLYNNFTTFWNNQCRWSRRKILFYADITQNTNNVFCARKK